MEEKRDIIITRADKNSWITLPMRDWDDRISVILSSCVLLWITLPMRDWDYIIHPQVRVSWLQRITLPMRDWDIFSSSFLFMKVIYGLHYLWGIETIVAVSFIHPLILRITLPMRDWDNHGFDINWWLGYRDYITYEGLRLF